MKFPRPTHPWKTECFPAPERGEFSKNSGILQLVKMGSFWGEPCAAQCASGWLVGMVLKTTAPFRLFLRSVLTEKFDDGWVGFAFTEKAP